MDELAFGASAPLTVGVELELQLVRPHDFDLARDADELLRAPRQAQAAGRGEARDHRKHDRAEQLGARERNDPPG